VIYAVLAVICFAAGAYTFKIMRTGSTITSLDGQTSPTRGLGHLPIIMVGETAITGEDLDWEYGLQTEGIMKTEQMTPIPDLGDSQEKTLLPLRERLLSDLIERKLLYQFIEQDSHFDIARANRYVDCLADWKETISRKDLPPLLSGADNQERLKSRLCEQSILTQYLRERVFPRAKASDAEIAAYYKDHREALIKPERVLIRHILIKDEDAANEVHARLNGSNFPSLAKETSTSPEAEQGGLMGPFGRHELPSTFDVAFSMVPGQISEVLKSQSGHHIIYLEKRWSREEPSLAEATERVRKILLAKKQESEYQQWVERAMKAISIRTPRTP
jgi:parvulin-like peptidyl-prolyl isomerase